MSWLTHLFEDVKQFFMSPKARAVEQQISQLLPLAMTVVGTINTMAPNRTLGEINLIATKYALPAVTSISTDPTQVGNVLLNLGSQILAKNVKNPTTLSTLNTVIQVVMTALKNQGA